MVESTTDEATFGERRRELIRDLMDDSYVYNAETVQAPNAVRFGVSVGQGVPPSTVQVCADHNARILDEPGDDDEYEAVF